MRFKRILLPFLGLAISTATFAADSDLSENGAWKFLGRRCGGIVSDEGIGDTVIVLDHGLLEMKMVVDPKCTVAISGNYSLDGERIVAYGLKQDDRACDRHLPPMQDSESPPCAIEKADTGARLTIKGGTDCDDGTRGDLVYSRASGQ
jgi:hypothetical protein